MVQEAGGKNSYSLRDAQGERDKTNFDKSHVRVNKTYLSVYSTSILSYLQSHF